MSPKPRNLPPKNDRSLSYQWLLVELPCGLEFWDLPTPPPNHGPERFELVLQLQAAVWRVAEASLTPYQLKVLRMRFKDGYTQIETAKLMGITDGNICKSLHGNITKGKRYGGSLKKLSKACDQDSEIQTLLQRIEDLNA